MRGTEILAEEREVISRELAVGSSYRCIGRLLKRDHSVVSREVTRMVADRRIKRYPPNSEPTFTVPARSRDCWKRTRRCMTR